MGKKEKTTAQKHKIRIQDEAYNDIEQITDFIANQNQQPLTAIKIADSIFQIIDKIGNNPFAYKECEAIPTKSKIYRQAICSSWLIIFRISPIEILILGIVHGARNPSEIKKLKRKK